MRQRNVVRSFYQAWCRNSGCTPEGLKDPADFIEAVRFRRRNCESFRREIVEPPATGRIGICSDCLLSRPYRNKRDVLAVLDIFERVADFLPALWTRPIERNVLGEVPDRLLE
jgi:hypothetical protein